MKRPSIARSVFQASVWILTLSLGLTTSTAQPFNIADGDVAGLIAAINTANGNGVADIINLAPGGLYTLTVADNADNGLPLITSEIIVNGNGATVRRSNTAGVPNFRILTVFGASGDLSLNSVTIYGGRGTRFGGGLSNLGGKLTLRKSSVVENTSVPGPGTGGGGGGIYNQCGTLVVINSTVSSNTGFGANGGGGILNGSSCASIVQIISSTLFENRADALPGFEGHGDAIANHLFSPQIVLKGSIIASPTQGIRFDCYAGRGPGGAFIGTSFGSNLSSDASCSLTQSGDLNSTDPLLLPLANNGGNTPTNLPVAGSPVINAVPFGDCSDLTGATISIDQRGVLRPQGLACDIGSVEFVLDSDADGVFDDDDNCPSDANADQADLDGDGVGDACDTELGIDGATATLGAMVDDLGLKAGLANALKSKLANAFSSFLAGDLGAAANQLNAFINQVNAKRGKDLSDTEADALVAAAQDIIDAINAGTAGKRSALFDFAGNELPETVLLAQNYPNPFNPQTTIRFGVPETSDVRLVVYDVLGREVKVLLHGTVSAGMHQAAFDASSLPSGSYIYQLTTPEGRISKMMLLLK